MTVWILVVALFIFAVGFALSKYPTVIPFRVNMYLPPETRAGRQGASVKHVFTGEV